MKQQVSTALLCLSLAAVMAGRVLAQFGPRAHAHAVEAAVGRRRDHGREGEGSELEGAADAVGPSGPRGHLDERRHARHSDDAAGGAGGARVADARGVRARAPAATKPRAIARSTRRGPAQRVRRADVRLHVVRRRSAGRPHAGADAGGDRARRASSASAPSATGPFNKLRGLHALRPLHHARRRRPIFRCSTATASGSCRRRTKSSSATR